VLFQTKYKRDLSLDLEIVSLIDILVGKKHGVFYQTDVNFQQMELMKEEEMKYFDNLVVIVYVSAREAICNR
jgi:hypothetical protein